LASPAQGSRSSSTSKDEVHPAAVPSLAAIQSPSTPATKELMSQLRSRTESLRRTRVEVIQSLDS
jgi:hypothetical protein